MQLYFSIVTLQIRWLMSGKDEEENGSEDDEEYIPSDPEEDVDDEQNENGGSSGDDGDAVNGNSAVALQESKQAIKILIIFRCYEDISIDRQCFIFSLNYPRYTILMIRIYL